MKKLVRTRPPVRQPEHRLAEQIRRMTGRAGEGQRRPLRRRHLPHAQELARLRIGRPRHARHRLGRRIELRQPEPTIHLRRRPKAQQSARAVLKRPHTRIGRVGVEHPGERTPRQQHA